MQLHRSFLYLELEIDKLVAACVGKSESNAHEYEEQSKTPHSGEGNGGIKARDGDIFAAGFDNCCQSGNDEDNNSENAPGTDVHNAVLPKGNSADNIPRDGEGGGAEEYPAEDYEDISRSGRNDLSERAALVFLAVSAKLHPKLVDAKGDAMKRAPGNKSPGSAVPKTAYKHSEEEVDISASCSATISAEGDIKVFHQPG